MAMRELTVSPIPLVPQMGAVPGGPGTHAPARLQPLPPAAVAPGAGRSAGAARSRGRLRWRRAVTPVAVLAAWQIGASTGLVDQRTLSSPWRVASTAGSLIADGSLPRNLAVSLGRIGAGLGIGLTAGLVLGVVAGLFLVGEDLIDAPVQMLKSIPVLALIPLFILWFGIGELPKVLIIAFASFFPLYLNTFSAARNVDERLVEAGRTLGLSRWELIRHVIVPGALPGVLVGLRTSFGVSVIALVVSEQLNASSGIGFLMSQAQQFFQTNVIFVGVLVYAVLGLTGDLIVRRIERRALAWRRSFTGS